MPRTLYVVEGSPPARAAWMGCVASGMDFNVRFIDFVDKMEHLEDWFIQINPHHKVPTLDDNGHVLWESRAIMRYVMDVYAPDNRYYPKDVKQRALINRSLDYDLSVLSKTCALTMCPEIFFYEPPVDHGPVKAELEYLETHTPIADGKFIAGDHMTIADMSAVACVTFLEPINFDFSPFPKIQEWVAKMKAEPFYTECNACFEDWKVEVKTDEWKRKNEIRMAKKGKSVFKSILTNPDVKAPKSIEADTK